MTDEAGADDTFCSIIEKKDAQCKKYFLRTREHKPIYFSEILVQRLRKINGQIKKHKKKTVILESDQLRELLAELSAATFENLDLRKNFKKLIKSNIQYLESTINYLGNSSISNNRITRPKSKSTLKSPNTCNIGENNGNISSILLQTDSKMVHPKEEETLNKNLDPPMVHLKEKETFDKNQDPPKVHPKERKTDKNQNPPKVHPKQEETCDTAEHVGIFKTKLLDMKNVEEFLNRLCEPDNGDDDVTQSQLPQSTSNGAHGKQIFNGLPKVADSSFKNTNIKFKAVENIVSNCNNNLYYKKCEQNLTHKPKIIVDSISEVQSIKIKANQLNLKSFPEEPDFEELFRDFQQIMEISNVEFFSQHADYSDSSRTQRNFTNLLKDINHSTPIPSSTKLAGPVEYSLSPEDVVKVALKLNVNADKLKEAIESVLFDDEEDSFVPPSQSPTERRYSSSQIRDDDSMFDFLNIRL